MATQVVLEHPRPHQSSPNRAANGLQMGQSNAFPSNGVSRVLLKYEWIIQWIVAPKLDFLRTFSQFLTCVSFGVCCEKNHTSYLDEIYTQWIHQHISRPIMITYVNIGYYICRGVYMYLLNLTIEKNIFMISQKNQNRQGLGMTLLSKPLTSCEFQVAQLPRTSKLTLSGNRLVCDCNTLWLKQWLITGRHQVTDIRLRLRLRQSLFNINRYMDTSIISGLHAIDRNTNNIIPLINYEI